MSFLQLLPMELLQQLWGAVAAQREFYGGLLLMFLLSLLLVLLRQQPAKRKLKLPPSPFPSLPLLGNVLHLDSVGRTANLQGLRDKLGPIFTLHVGNTPVIYITSASLAHEALVGKGLLFAARPTCQESRTIFTNNFRSINAATYGPLWRALRRNLVQEMLAAPKVSAFKAIRNRVLNDMMSSMRAEALDNGGVISVHPHLRDSFFHLLLFMCFGFHMPKETLLEVLNPVDAVLSLSGGTFTDYYPCLHVFDGKRRQKVHALRAKQLKVYTALIEKHKEMKKLGQLAPGSYLETLLNGVDASIPLSIDDLVTLCVEFSTVGSDSTVTTLEWAMARLVENPRLQQKLYKQIHEVMGNKLVEEEDLQRFPYLQAFVRETLRLHPPVHFLLPHSTSKLCTVGGYDIPPNAIVMFHVMFIAKDPEIWKEPLKFEPERFLEANVDITGSKEMRMMPFGAGRRICPGLGMANMHMELVVARLVQRFEWCVWPAASSVDFSERVVFNVRMKKPLKALVKERM